ncbi:MAG: biotin--[acetyl-CoA-carboxylase] ligase [Schwartzia sp.]|nr:biotin--[acetyl-CoA-carboxylase] ligase [Schwartzia sp. (in: firmicutes)]
MKMKLHHYDVLDSTNETAEQMAKAGALEGTVIMADRQRGGHGRMQRRWESPLGGLWSTLVLRPTIDPCHVAQVTLLAGIAVTLALRSMYDSEDIRIKWPNDIFFNGKKIGGILSEMRLHEREGIEYVLVGMGLNVNLTEKDFPEELRSIATSLKIIFKKDKSCESVLTKVFNEFTVLYNRWNKEGMDAILPEWEALNCTLGRTVTVWDAGQRIFEGKAVSMSRDGSLLVRSEDGTEESFNFGEISIREC